eukprot:7233074-Pyramimonas_sp.AAC.1
MRIPTTGIAAITTVRGDLPGCTRVVPADMAGGGQVAVHPQVGRNTGGLHYTRRRREHRGAR